MARPTLEQLADHYRREWLCERATAETVPCPPRPFGCGVPAGSTCVNPIRDRELDGPPAHGARIAAAARAAIAARQPRTAPSVPSPRSSAA